MGSELTFSVVKDPLAKATAHAPEGKLIAVINFSDLRPEQDETAADGIAHHFGGDPDHIERLMHYSDDYGPYALLVFANGKIRRRAHTDPPVSTPSNTPRYDGHDFIDDDDDDFIDAYE